MFVEQFPPRKQAIFHRSDTDPRPLTKHLHMASAAEVQVLPSITDMPPTSWSDAEISPYGAEGFYSVDPSYELTYSTHNPTPGACADTHSAITSG